MALVNVEDDEGGSLELVLGGGFRLLEGVGVEGEGVVSWVCRDVAGDGV